MDITKGTVVLVKAGREKGKFLVVTEIKDNKCFIVNGKNRTISKPKCKNILHLTRTNTVFNLTVDTTDKQIRKFLNEVFGI